MLGASEVTATSLRYQLNSDLWFIQQQTGNQSQKRESRVLLLLLYALVLRTTARGGSDKPTLWLSIGEDSLVRRIVSLVYQQKAPPKQTRCQNVLLWFPYKQELRTEVPKGNQVIATNPTKPKADSGVAMFLQSSLKIAFPAEPKSVEFGEILELSRYSPDRAARSAWRGLQPRRAWASLFAQAEKLIKDRICVGVGSDELRSYFEDMKKPENSGPREVFS